MNQHSKHLASRIVKGVLVNLLISTSKVDFDIFDEKFPIGNWELELVNFFHYKILDRNKISFEFQCCNTDGIASVQKNVFFCRNSYRNNPGPEEEMRLAETVYFLCIFLQMH